MAALLALSLGCGETLPGGEPAPSVETHRSALAQPLSVTRVAAGAYHSLALRSDGVVWAWGQDTEGQLGRGSVSPVPQPTPLPLALPGTMTAVAAGGGHSLALGADGRVWAWGRNNRGQAGGANTAAPVLTPAVVPLSTQVIAIAARADYSLAVDVNGDLWAWGQNTDGELGQHVADGLPHPTPVKVQLPALAPDDPYIPSPESTFAPADIYKFTSVAAGGHHVLALTRTGRIWAWGRNDAAQVGTGEESQTPVLVPTLIRNIRTAKGVAAGEAHSLFYDDEGLGNATTWGLNTSGQAGRDYVAETPPLARQFVRTPFSVNGAFAGGGVAAGDDFSLFILGYPYGTLLTWGANGHGQVGNGTTELQPAPVAALRWDSYWQTYVHVTDVGLAAGGARHGLSAHNERWEYTGCPVVWAWGDNSQGQLGTGSLTPAGVQYVQPGLPLRRFYLDADGDGYGNPSQVQQTCAAPEGYVELLDCDDSSAAVNPLAQEVCDGIDNDCNGETDENGCAFWYRDADGDGFGNLNDFRRSGVQPAGYVSDSTDCDDTRSTVRPGGTEVCDGLDNNCSGQPDEGVGATWYRDADGDGFGDASQDLQSCEGPAGYVSNAEDCNDSNASVTNGQMYYRDSDSDGYGSPSNSTRACSRPSGYVTNSSDCNDSSSAAYPGRSEVCDGIDNNCNGQADEGVGSTWYRDADGDGFGNPIQYIESCGTPGGYVSNADDCDDSNASVTYGETYYWDADGDGYGIPSNSTWACSHPSGYVTNSSDCNDSNSAINPGRPEVCDGIDNNCNSQTDEGVKSTWYRDADGDGYGNSSNSTWACSRPSGYVTNSSDCNDSNSAINPGRSEACDGIDNNCNSQTDEGVRSTWYRDADGDGLGNPSQSAQACGAPTGYVSNADDCNDSNASVTYKGTYYRDADGDGWGNGQAPTYACYQPAGYTVNASDCNDSNPSIGEPTVWYQDYDGDSYGHAAHSLYACTRPNGHTDNGNDCHDYNSAIHPGAAEVCNDWDDDCDGQVNENGTNVYYRDADGDGWGNGHAPTYACSQPSGYTVNASDCNDSNPSIGEPTPWYKDSDGDGYVQEGQWVYACTKPGGYVAGGLGLDCNDGASYINPGEPELCTDYIDNNCDGYTEPYCYYDPCPPNRTDCQIP